MIKVNFAKGEFKGAINQIEEKLFVATTNEGTKEYKTERGARAYMEKMGYIEVAQEVVAQVENKRIYAYNLKVGMEIKTVWGFEKVANVVVMDNETIVTVESKHMVEHRFKLNELVICRDVNTTPEKATSEKFTSDSMDQVDLKAEIVAEVDKVLTKNNTLITPSYGITREQMIDLLYNVRLHPELSKLFNYVSARYRKSIEGEISDLNISLNVSSTVFKDGEYIKSKSKMDGIDAVIKGSADGGFIVYDYSWDEDNVLREKYNTVSETVQALLNM